MSLAAKVGMTALGFAESEGHREVRPHRDVAGIMVRIWVAIANNMFFFQVSVKISSRYPDTSRYIVAQLCLGQHWLV